MALYKPGSSSTSSQARGGTTEFDILKASHKFLRDDEDDSKLSWNDQLAKKYYASLYREYAVCDLKHYKSGQFALRWRTESEVISGAGESTCGNTRCPLHTDRGDDVRPSLTVLELPFQYVEDGAPKSALVKVTLCPKCCTKLMWKRTKEKEKERAEAEAEHAGRKRKAERGADGSGGGAAQEQEAETKRVRMDQKHDLAGHRGRRRRSAQPASPSHDRG